MKRIQLIYAALLVLVLASPAWLWLELQPGQKQRESVPPEIPASPVAHDEALLSKVMAKNLWGQARGRVAVEAIEGDDGASVVSKRCKLKAIAYAQMVAPLAQFDCGGQPSQSWREKDLLPDQSMLAEIHSDYVVIKRGEERLRVYLFGKE